MLRKFIYFAKTVFLIIIIGLICNVNSVDASDSGVESYPDYYYDDYDDDGGGDDDDDDGGDDDDDDDSHNTGQDCLRCHGFKLAGTVYTDKAGSTPVYGATVKITSNNSSVYMLTDRSGNFRSKTSFSGTYSVTISYGANQISMVGTPSYGGCNIGGCHSAGSSYGRVYINDSLDISTGILKGYVYSDTIGATSLSYNSNIKTIFDNKCILCHKAGGLRSESPLTTYSETLNVLTPGNSNSSLITQTATGGLMASYLTGNEALEIRSWIIDYSAAETSASSSGVIAGAIVTLGNTSVTSGSDGSFTFSNVTPGTYTVTITAMGYGQSSTLVTVTVGSTTTSNVTLTKTSSSAPAGYTGSVSGSTVSTSWDAVSGAAGYKIYYGFSPGNYEGSVDLGNVISFTFTDIADGTYYIAMAAYDSAGNESSKSSEVSVTVSGASISAPANYSGSVSGSTVSTSWDAVSGAAGYRIYYGSSPGNYEGSVDLGNATSQTFILIPNGTYYIAMTAYDSAGNESSKSNEVSVTVISHPFF